MGAWIEISYSKSINSKIDVAPHVGAWIEIRKHFSTVAKIRASHPMWVRGLKYYCLDILWLFQIVAPHVGAWIEMRRSVS